MSSNDATVLMVGSVPADTAEDVFRLLGPGLGARLIGTSDGEPGYRNKWIVFNAPHVFEPNPGLEAINKPKPNRDKSIYEDLEDWVPTSWEEMWRFRVRDGVTAVSFDNLHYADFARESYISGASRSRGAHPATRSSVSAATSSGYRSAFRNPRCSACTCVTETSSTRI